MKKVEAWKCAKCSEIHPTSQKAATYNHRALKLDKVYREASAAYSEALDEANAYLRATYYLPFYAETDKLQEHLDSVFPEVSFDD